MSDAEKCALCNRPRREHEQAEIAQEIHHRFAGPGGSLVGLDGSKPEKKDDKATVKVFQGPPGDPVLRTILIEKGIITIEDLEKAERVLGATGVLRTHGDSASGH